MSATSPLRTSKLRTPAIRTGVLTLGPLLTGRRREHFSAILRQLATLVDDGHIRPSLHGDPMTMSDVNEAYALVAGGTATGKVVLQGW